jgi:hypothetical protein
VAATATSLFAVGEATTTTPAKQAAPGSGQTTTTTGTGGGGQATTTTASTTTTTTAPPPSFDGYPVPFMQNVVPETGYSPTDACTPPSDAQWTFNAPTAPGTLKIQFFGNDATGAVDAQGDFSNVTFTNGIVTYSYSGHTTDTQMTATFHKDDGCVGDYTVTWDLEPAP